MGMNQTTSDSTVTAEKDHLNVIHLLSKTERFSDGSVHLPGRSNVTCMEIDDDPETTAFILEVYANGRKNAGYVSVELKLPDGVLISEGSCFIYVLDASDNERFSRSFTFSDESTSLCVDGAFCISIDDYVARETLLREPEELLPNDTLTLLAEIRLSHWNEFLTHSDVYGRLGISFGVDSEKNVCLLLDTPLGKRLREESVFFQRMLDTPMAEKQTRRMRLSDRADFAAFRDMGYVLLGMNPVHYETVCRILDMCVAADKYDIPYVIETCSCFLKLVLFHRAYTISQVLRDIEDNYESEPVKHYLKNLVQASLQCSDDENKLKSAGDRLKLQVRDCEWTFRSDGLLLGTSFNLWFENQRKPIKPVEEEAQHDFYK